MERAIEGLSICHLLAVMESCVEQMEKQFLNEAPAPAGVGEVVLVKRKNGNSPGKKVTVRSTHEISLEINHLMRESFPVAM